MKQIDEILNQIGDFECTISNEIVPIIGVLSYQEKAIIFQGRIDAEIISKLDPVTPLQIWGEVDATPVTLLNGYVRSMHTRIGSEYASVMIEPSEIVVGRSESGEIWIKKLSVSIKELNHMFSSGPLKPLSGVSKDNPAILTYTFPDTIETNDKYGHLEIFQAIDREWSSAGITHLYCPVIHYTFTRSIKIMDAVGKIAAVRNLFSFFANYYLPMEDFEFGDEKSSKSKAFLYLNRKEDVLIPDDPFLIMTSNFSSDFSEIWKKWLNLYEKVTPIPTLFFEIICDRSTRTNCFLNLSQAMEVYSSQYREEYAKALKQQENAKAISLKHRLEDIFSLLLPCLDISKDDILPLAEALSKMRNYFTHYNEKQYIRPNYHEVFSANHVLRLVLLIIVYKEIGISNEEIIECQKYAYFSRIGEDYKILLNYAQKCKSKIC